MKRTLFFIAAALLSVQMLAYNVFIFDGDSITAGSADSPDGWVAPGTNIAIQCSHLPFFQGATITNVAVGGQGIDDLLSGFAAHVQPLKPGAGTNAYLIFMIGANDANVASSAWDAWVQKWTNYCNMGRTNGFIMVASTPTRYNLNAQTTASLSNWNQVIRSSTNNYSYLQDAYNVLPNENDDSMYYSSGVHPTALGISLLASNLNRVLIGRVSVVQIR